MSFLNAEATEYLREYCQALGEAAGAQDVREQFSITPVMETNLRQAILHSNAFLQLIAHLPVDQTTGQVIDVGDGGLATGRKENERFYAEFDQNGNTYELTETDSGAYITWATLSQWANSGGKDQWVTLMNNAITRNFALDMLRIGFHGTHVAKNTDPAAYPLGQDVNKGWVAIVKEKMPDQVVETAKLDSTGQTEGSYRNTHALGNDLLNNYIHEVHVEDPDLVFLVGRNIVAAEEHRMLSAADKPTELNAVPKLSKDIAGKAAYTPPFFPPNMMMLTSLKNLQILTQKNTQHRDAKNVGDRKRFETQFLRWEGYAVGNMKKFAVIENVELVDSAAPVMTVEGAAVEDANPDVTPV
ncbi:phage major capsid protein, P2 family [Vibrio parahaemolyticus]|uniref:phage major capsid protein, P2 family n=1 Tax=Vibrio parahaemolyticus TaxID=670 RepID=UPI000A37EA97|nr:phage major capsid protein, P2 family [Vibrio parahaemolyticus]OUD24775.1 phage major capsid protein, P2 family [Vibrio parahaemolyticus]HCH0718816.1 phage major capsid protein, P2 family [Vibrio parahaemolyticus]HCM1069088.1 phage major capsid protein, P2 family [Vibrio parahaemolyticus]HCM1085020.1 phage major capsid protein, P2 family [Vibrio parahaemolyticus]